MRSVQDFFSEANSMSKTNKITLATISLSLLMSGLNPFPLRAEEAIQKAGVAAGVTAGNMWFLPIKAISVSMGILSGALSYVVTGGNSDLTKQIWQDTTSGPYVISPEVARKAIGERPELLEKP
jgi:hypothetical protein